MRTDIHPDLKNRRGFIIAPGRRYQLTRSSCFLLAATATVLGSGRSASLRFFTSELPDDSARDRTRCFMAIDCIAGQGQLAEADEEAAFEAGIFVEAYGDQNSDPSIDITSLHLSICWVDRQNYPPSFGKVDCFLKEAWEKAPCRKDTPLWSNYDKGQTFDIWEQSDNTSGTPSKAGGGWPGDGGEVINDEEGGAIIDAEGAPAEEEISIIESDAFDT